MIVAGDVGETAQHLEFAWSTLSRRFHRIIWVPGNHELWTMPHSDSGLMGEAKYRQLVELCRSYGVLTPEDPFALWQGIGGPCLLAPLFVLYDYSFRPSGITEEDAVEWAAQSGTICADELLLRTDPYPSPQEWCRDRLRVTERRLKIASRQHDLVLINHFPLRSDLVHVPHRTQMLHLVWNAKH